MNNQKWNKELFYSIIFFVVAFTWFFYNPFSLLRDFIDSLPNALDIKSKLFNLGIFPIFYNVVNIMKVGFYFFLLCSIYAGIKSWRKSLKTLSILFISLIFLTPQIVSAVWWNPGTWFKKDVPKEELKQDTGEEKPNVVKQEKKPTINTSSKNKETPKVELPAQASNLQSDLQMVKGEIQNKNTEINSLKKTLAELQKNLAQENPQCKQVVIEKVVYQDRIVEKPKVVYEERIIEKLVEKIVYKDRVVEKPTEKIVFQDKIIEKLVEKIVYQDRIVEKPVEKIVYRDKIVQASCNSPVTPTPNTYSDYNFNYQWTDGRLSCPMTPRDIVIKKAVFKIPDSELQKINILGGLEADGLKLIMPVFPPLHARRANMSISDTYSLEETSPNTFVYFGGNIPICGDGGVVTIGGMTGSLMDITNQGRNVKIYLAQKGITVDVTSIANGVGFNLRASPIMTEWEIWDNTTNKPVKIP